MGTTASWPSGLSKAAISHCPPPLRADALQVAWLALSEGKKPDSAVRALVRHEQKHAAARPNFDLCTASGIRKRF
jgi:hypothetical protein